MFQDMQIPVQTIVNGDYLPRSEAKILGSRNVLPINYYEGVKAKTQNNATFTVNDDGSITVMISATMTADATFYLNDYKYADYMEGNYILSGGNDLNDKIRLTYADGVPPETSWNNYIFCESSDGILITPRTGANQQLIYLAIQTGAPAGTYRIYPMLRLSTDLDDTYTPPALSNRVLSRLTNPFNDSSLILPRTIITYPTLLAGSNYSTNSTFYYKVGTRVFVNVSVKDLTASAANTLFNLPKGYRPTKDIYTVGQTSQSIFSNISVSYSTGAVTVHPRTDTKAFGSIMFDAFL